jgi:UDP-N-acetylglucosamine 1-carboxyvinyltransferase
VEATDLRGGAALVVAALAAVGDSRVEGLQHIDRGYQELDVYLRDLGADVRRVVLSPDAV